MSKKQKKSLPLSKKQRKKLAKQGKAIPTEKAPRSRMSRVQKWTVSLVSMICVFGLVCAVFGGILLSRVIDSANADPYLSNYETLTMDRFLKTDKMGKSFYTKNVFDFSGIETAYAAKDLAYMDEYIEDLCFNYRELVKSGQKQTAIGMGDEVALYVIGAFDENGERIPADDMHLQSYIEPWTWQDSSGYYYLPVIGAAHLGGESFDNALIDLGVKPEDTYRVIRQNGTATMDDVVCVSYRLYKQKANSKVDEEATDLLDKYTWDTTTVIASKDGMRVTLSDAKEIDQVIANALIDNLPVIGEDYSFVLEDYNPTTNATDKGVYRVDANVHFVVEEEKYVDVTFTTDDDFFKEGDGGNLTKYNGKEMTFRLVILSMNDYEIPEFNREFITETLGFEVEATDDEGAVKEYKEKQLAIINEELAESRRKSKIGQIYLNLAEKASNQGYLVTTDYPASLSSSVRESAFEDLQNMFISTYGVTPTEETLNSFAASYAYSQAGAQISTYSEYLELVVQSQIPQELIMYYVFRDAGMEITDEEIDAELEERLAAYVEKAGDSETYTREYFIDYYGGETAMKKQIRRDLVYEKVGAYLLENNSGKK